MPHLHTVDKIFKTGEVQCSPQRGTLQIPAGGKQGMALFVYRRFSPSPLNTICDPKILRSGMRERKKPLQHSGGGGSLKIRNHIPCLCRGENLFNTSETRTLPTEYHPSFFIPAKTQPFTHSLKIKQKIFCLGKCLGRHPCKLCYHHAWHYKKSGFQINFISLPAGF